MELKLKTESKYYDLLTEDDIFGLGIFYEKDETLKDGFCIAFNTLYSQTLDQVDEGVLLSKESLVVLHGFLTSILKLEQ